ncbi:MAG: extracellular solute-binding protein [Candidatus Hydrogenedentes bacterium]|nr:extracellular solute-binding protein [Candidatus Hydrogenedentota bacterium]
MSEPRVGWYAVIDAFEKKYPNVEVVIGPTDRGEDLQKLLSGVVGNSPPDVFRRESALFGDIASRDILMPLKMFVDADKDKADGLHEEDYPSGVWQSCFYNGELYGIPESTNPHVLAYNRKIFREAGLDPDKPPATWDEWLDVTRRLTQHDSDGHITRMGTVFNVRDELSFYITQLGGKVFSEDGGRCQLDTPEGLQALTFLKALYDAQGGRQACDQFGATQIANDQNNPFGLGKVAMSVEDDWIIFRIMRFNPDIELGIAPVPAPAGHPPVTVSPTSPIYMIPVNARHPKEGWDFIRFVNSPEGCLIMAGAMDVQAREKGRAYMYPGLRPNRKVLAALSAKYSPQDPLLRQCYDNVKLIMEGLVPPPISPVSALLRDEMRRTLERTALGQMSPEAAIQDSNRRLQEQLDLFRERERFPKLRWAYVWAALFTVIAAGVAAIAFRSRGERAASPLQRRENRTGLVFISPWLTGFLVFIAGPMVFSIAISFCDYDVIHPARYVGARNYSRLLGNDPLFWKSLNNTAYMACALPIGMCVSLLVALLLNTKVKGMSVYRTLFYLPAITPAVAAAVLWYALLNPNGLINAGLNATICGWLGLHAPAWLQDPSWSKPALILMGLWGAGGGMILWLAGLQGIPQQLYEAAAIDGAGVWRRFRSITLPMLTPYIFFSLVTGIIGVFQIFGQALIITLGGPADSTLFYVYYLFNNAFRYFKMGYASAQAWILFLLVLGLTAIQWKLAKKWVHYD